MNWKLIFCRFFVSIQNNYFGDLREALLCLLQEAIRRLFVGECINGYNRRLSAEIEGLDRQSALDELARLKLSPFKRNISFVTKNDGALEIKASFQTLYSLCSTLE